MEQRSLRLGDIVDDYCPRERRITNHAIVAIVEDAIRQTRCTTCDAEHVYKHAREPRRRKKEDTTALYNEVLSDAVPGQLVQPQAGNGAGATAEAPLSGDPSSVTDAATDAPSPAPADEGWSMHRRLIRATLPKSEGDVPPPRPIPEFTMYQRPPQHRGHGFRRPRPQGHEANGNAHPRDDRRGSGGHGGGQGRPPAHGRPGRQRSRHKGPR